MRNALVQTQECNPVYKAENKIHMATERIRQGILNWDSTAHVNDLNIYKSELEKVAKQLHCYPELFYFDNCTMWSEPNTGKVTKVDLHYKAGFTPEHTTELEKAVNQALSYITPGMDELQKLLVLHDYLAMNVAYDQKNYVAQTIPSASYTPYGALVLRTAVCQGYTLAYQMLLKRCGIPSTYVSSKAMKHGWCMVQLWGDWYHVDVTWDDPAPDTPGMARHKYFLLSDAAISDEKHRHFGWVSEHVCRNDRFDSNMFWGNTDIPIPFTDSDTYWLLRGNGDGLNQTINLLRRSWSTGEYEVAASVKGCWPSWNKPGYYWNKAYSGLVLWNGRLFFNDKQHVYAYDPAKRTQEIVFTYRGGEGYLYGLTHDGSKMQYLLKQDAEQKTGTLRSFTVYN